MGCDVYESCITFTVESYHFDINCTHSLDIKWNLRTSKTKINLPMNYLKLLRYVIFWYDLCILYENREIKF